MSAKNFVAIVQRMAGRMKNEDAVRLAALKMLLKLATSSPVGELDDEDFAVAGLLKKGLDANRICNRLNIPLPDLTWSLIRLAR